MSNEFKRRMIHHVLDILPGTGVKIIDTDYFMSLHQEPVAQVRTEEACTTSHQNSFCCCF